MNFQAVEEIADAVMYEGYLLYPYRRSAIKNRQRFNFGVLYPRAHCEVQQGSDAWQMHTECLVSGHSSDTLKIKIRFLHISSTPEDFQEGIERELTTGPVSLASILDEPLTESFAFDPLQGEFELTASPIDSGLFRIALNIANLTAPNPMDEANRDLLLSRSLVSVHSILHVTGGEFISLLDPPDHLKSAAAECRNLGAFPVLAGQEGQRDLLLSAPIILYDYPRIAPESAGNLFDGTEIDEILALRILTMTDEEKREVRGGDDRARRILDRTELLPPEHFQKLHGALRGLTPVPEEPK